LIRQVASNITKQALVVSKSTEEGITEKLKATGDSRRLMTENTARAIKVWQAFVKFVKNQVTVNGRLVDTQLIGLFSKDEQGCAFFMPSPDYLDAGKFKLHRGTGGLCSKLGLSEGAVDLAQKYAETYHQKLSVSGRCNGLTIGEI